MDGAEAGGFGDDLPFAEGKEAEEIVAGLIGDGLAGGAGFGAAGGEFDAGNGEAGGVEDVAFEPVVSRLHARASAAVATRASERLRMEKPVFTGAS